MILVADEDKFLFAREHIDYMGDNRLAINFNEWFWHLITGTPETFAKP